MATHAEMAAQLLRDAAEFLRNAGDQNPEIREDLYENAGVYEEVADLVEFRPLEEWSQDEDDDVVYN